MTFGVPLKSFALRVVRLEVGLSLRLYPKVASPSIGTARREGIGMYYMFIFLDYVVSRGV
jgi:hypothetical protein